MVARRPVVAPVQPVRAHRGRQTVQQRTIRVETTHDSVLITAAEEGGYVFGAVCLSVCPSDYSQTCERILTKFFVGVGHGSRTK